MRACLMGLFVFFGSFIMGDDLVITEVQSCGITVEQQLHAEIMHLQKEIAEIRRENFAEVKQAFFARINAIESHMGYLQNSAKEIVQPLCRELDIAKNQLAFLEEKLCDEMSEIAQLYDYIDYLTEAQCEPAFLVGKERCGCFGIYVYGQYLYWELDEAGTEFAVETNAAPLLNPGTLINGDEKKIDFGFNSGYRLGIGYVLPCGGWDINASYTQLISKERKTDNTLANPSRAIFPLLLYQVSEIPSVEVADCSWRISFKNADLEVGRDFFITQCLTFKPVVGWKWAWIKQNIDVLYSGGASLEGLNYTIHADNDFTGNGLKLGMGSRWNFWNCLGLFANGSFSLLRGHFNVQQNQFLGQATALSLDTDIRRFVPTVQFALGLVWEGNCFSDCFHYSLSAAYENQYYWRQNQLARFTQQLNPNYIKTSEDLSLHGLTLGAQVCF